MRGREAAQFRHDPGRARHTQDRRALQYDGRGCARTGPVRGFHRHLPGVCRRLRHPDPADHGALFSRPISGARPKGDIRADSRRPLYRRRQDLARCGPQHDVLRREWPRGRHRSGRLAEDRGGFRASRRPPRAIRVAPPGCSRRLMAVPDIPGYLCGFGNEFSTEALPGALPIGRNSPQRCPYGLYAEQFSGTAFTAPRHAQRRSWLYRMRPAVTCGVFQPRERDPFARQAHGAHVTPNPLRWDPLPIPAEPTDFVDGLGPVAGNGSPDMHAGCGIYLYSANQSMGKRFFYSADGEWLIVPELGALRIDTELGRIDIEPQEIAVIPRGLRFRIDAPAGSIRGYVCENFGAPLKLPDLGPIGSNGAPHQPAFLT